MKGILKYHLNSFALKNEFFFNQNEQELHRGIKLSFSSLLPYERAEGKIILLSAFTSTSEDIRLQKDGLEEEILSPYIKLIQNFL